MEKFPKKCFFGASPPRSPCLLVFLQHKFHRNIDSAMSWIFPVLADRGATIKVQIFVLRKDTADILGKADDRGRGM